jgi:3-oxoacyl-[acyl-carrier-protein] synthase-3
VFVAIADERRFVLESANTMALHAAIVGWGMSVPSRVVTNAELSTMVDTSDEWIQSRTGIKERRIISNGETTSTLASAASRAAMAMAGVQAADIDMVIVATFSPDRPMPATACRVQAELGITNAAAFDIAAACSGFVYGLSVATSLIQTGVAKRILFCAADVVSHYVNWNDRNTCVLFGDGAGAVVLEATDQPYGLMSSDMGDAGDREDLLMVEAGGTCLPLTGDMAASDRRFLTMNGREVFKLAVRGMEESSLAALSKAHLTLADIAVVVPHQANRRIIEAIAERLGVPIEQFYINVQRYGNTSAATIPMALTEAVAEGVIHNDTYVLLTAFGGGLTWASAVVRWGIPSVRLPVKA